MNRPNLTVYRARTEAAIAPSSMVSTSAPLTTTAVLRKYRPMFASVQARLQLSKRSFDGRLQALVRISLSDLNALRTAQISGNVVSTAQPTRTVWEKALTTP